MDFGYLETIGKFVGTYGLAVFLVLYYAVRLYPEMQKERAEWIRQITRLRQLVDPGTRPLTRDQARTVLQLAGDALADRLRLVLDTRSYISGSTWATGPSDTRVSASLFGQDFSFDPEAQLDGDGRDKELEKIVIDIQRALKDEARRSRDSLVDALKITSDMARRDAYRLALLRFGNKSLETVWQQAHDESTRQLSEGLGKTLEPSKRYEIEEIRRFVAKHPSSSSKRDSLETLFAEIRFASGQEHATFLKTVFDKHVEEELRKIDASDEEI